MGLDISLRLLKPIPPEDVKPNEHGDVDFPFWVHTTPDVDFPGRDEGAVGTFVIAKDRHVQSWSYSGYTRFREMLAAFAGWPSIQAAWGAEEGCLWELLNFRDNEGVLGPVVCSKLLLDMRALSERGTEPLAHHRAAFYALLSAFEESATAPEGLVGILEFH